MHDPTKVDGISSTGLRIREARRRDALELVALQREVLAEDRWFIRHPDEAALSVSAEEERIDALGGASNAGLWVARLERRLVGLLSLVPPPFDRTRHVVKLEVMVAASARGRGVGRALIAHGQEWVRQHPTVAKIGLNVFADNEPAIGLYRSLGFQQEGRRVGEYLESDGSLRDDVLLYWQAEGPRTR